MIHALSHRIGIESTQTWNSVWEFHKQNDALLKTQRLYFHDGEKGLGNGLERYLTLSTGVLDPTHLTKNINKNLGGAAGKTAVGQYQRAFYAPDDATLALRKAEFIPKLEEYLRKHDDMALYPCLHDNHDIPIYSSQGPFTLQFHVYVIYVCCGDSKK